MMAKYKLNGSSSSTNSDADYSDIKAKSEIFLYLLVPGFSQGVYDPVFDGPSACTANRDSHFVVTTKTEQFSSFLTSIGFQFYPGMT